jgi:hypothetical protein
MPDFLLRQRWYSAKYAGRPEVIAEAVLSHPAPGTPAAVVVWRVTPPGQAAMHFFVPLALVPTEAASEPHVIAAPPGEPAAALRIVEAFSADSFVRAWIDAVLQAQEPLQLGTLRSGRTEALAKAGLAAGTAFAIRRSSAEQSIEIVLAQELPDVFDWI